MLTIPPSRKLENMTGDLILLSNPKLHKAVFPALKSLSGGISIDGEFDECVPIH